MSLEVKVRILDSQRKKDFLDREYSIKQKRRHMNLRDWHLQETQSWLEGFDKR